jgi:hypothetical protein
MAPSTDILDRVARRFQAAVLFRDQHETDEYIGTCSEGTSVGTFEVLQLLVSRGIEPTEVRFTKRLAENITRFEATTETGTVVGTVTIKTKFTPEKVDAYSEVTLDQDAEDGNPVPAAASLESFSPGCNRLVEPPLATSASTCHARRSGRNRDPNSVTRCPAMAFTPPRSEPDISNGIARTRSVKALC